MHSQFPVTEMSQNKYFTNVTTVTIIEQIRLKRCYYHLRAVGLSYISVPMISGKLTFLLECRRLNTCINTV